MTDEAPKTVVVTGGSKGIGRAVCLALTEPGARIYFNYARDDQAAAETIRLVEEKGGAARGIKASVADEAAVTAFFDRVLSETGGLNVLVNNAGITRDGLLVRMKEKDWDEVIAVNLKGVFLCSRMAAKPMIRQRAGRIITMTSVVGVSGNPGQVNYVASKAGVIGFTKALAGELASRNITVNAVAPGYIDTEMTASLTEKARESMIARVPLGRAGTPDDVAAAVAFLASDRAAYITGQVIHVSGGMYM